MRTRRLGLVLALVFLLSGCWSRRELTDVSFAGVVGFDWVEEQYLVTIAVHSPGEKQDDKGGKPTGRTVWTLSELAPSPDVAFAQLDQILPRSLTLSHVRSIIFGEEMARRGIGPIMDLLLRSVEIRPTAWVGVTNGRASELLAAEPLQGVMTEGPLGYHGAAQQRSMNMPARRLTEVANTLQEEGVDLTLPLFRRGDVAAPNPVQAQDEGALRAKPEDANEIVYGGAGVFRNDKLVGWFTPREARGQLWGMDRAGHGAMAALCPKGPPNQRVVFRLRGSNGRARTTMVQGKPQGIIRVRVVADVNEITCLDPVVGQDVGLLKGLMTDRVRRSIEESLEVSRREGADVFGFGQSLFRQAPAVFKAMSGRWDQVLKEMPVTVEVDARVVRLGQMRRRFQWREAH